jgi:hypothetical protein
MLLGMYDWEVIKPESNTTTQPTKQWSRCLDQLWRASKRANASDVNFVLTHHWVPRSPSTTPRNQPLSQYCLMHGTDGNPKCYAWTQKLIDELRDSLKTCFSEAMRMGLTVHVRPHLDDASPQRSWRDALAFDPAAPYGGFSYVDIMLNPVADALGLALKATSNDNNRNKKQKVYFSLQGEMGATVAQFPQQWAQLADTMRARVLEKAGGKNNSDADVLIGLGINFTGLVKDAPSGGGGAVPLFGWLLAAPTSTTKPSQTTSSLIQTLFNEKLDFLGVSAYAPMSGPGFPLKELEAAAFNVRDSLASYGVDLKKLIDTNQLELHYSELGLGGAGRDSNGRPARSARDAAKTPWAGIDAALGTYLPALDPWRYEALRLFAVEFYSKLAAWLAEGENNKTFKVSKVFIWSHNSFDVLGVVSFWCVFFRVWASASARQPRSPSLSDVSSSSTSTPKTTTSTPSPPTRRGRT